MLVYYIGISLWKIFIFFLFVYIISCMINNLKNVELHLQRYTSCNYKAIGIVLHYVL